jgi:MFS family permease
MPTILTQYPGNSFLEMGWRVMFFTGIVPGLVATSMIVATVTSLFGQIFTGFVSQYIGRRKTIMLVAAIAAMVVAIPSIYGLYHATTLFERIVYLVILIMAATTGFGPIPAFLAERFQTSIRNNAVWICI